MGPTVLAILFSISLSTISVYAQVTLPIPRTPSSDRPFIQRDLPTDTILQGRLFTMLIPKGWSVVSVGAGDRYLDNITVTASNDVVNERTYIGLQTYREFISGTPEAKLSREKAALKPGDALTYETWQDWKWIVKEYSCESGTPKSPARCWAAWAYDQNGEVGLLVASTPSELVSRYGDSLRKMMQSVQFRPLDNDLNKVLFR